MTATNYPKVFRPLASQLTESVFAEITARTRAGHHLAIISGVDRGAVRDLSLGLVRELYPTLATTGVWFITDYPTEIPVGLASGEESAHDWYFGGGRGVFNPEELPPLPAGVTDTEPTARLLRESSRRDLDTVCILSPLRTTEAWEIALNLFLTGTTIIIGIERPTESTVELPHTAELENLLSILSSAQIYPLIINTDTGTLSGDITTIITLVK